MILSPCQANGDICTEYVLTAHSHWYSPHAKPIGDICTEPSIAGACRSVPEGGAHARDLHGDDAHDGEEAGRDEGQRVCGGLSQDPQ